MDTLHVVLCGTDAFRVDTALQGSIENTHPAWNRSYTISCTSVLGVEQIDRRVLLVCNLIVLCKGARPSRLREAYSNRPVIALDDAPQDCIDGIADAEFYYGRCTLESLREKLIPIALAPAHVLYDTLLQCLTPMGERAFQRAMWVLDRDCDGALNAQEVVAWRRLVESASFEEADVGKFFTRARAAIAEGEGEQPAHDDKKAAGITTMNEATFTNLHLRWLAAGNALEAWATLHAVGTHPDGQPYTWYDLHSLRIDPSTNTYLSSHAISFFIGIHKRHRFHEEDADMWTLTPGCPWDDIDGFLHHAIPLDRFIEYWKYMALGKHDTVIMYARYWGYKGDAALLLSRRHTRLTRTPQEPLPNLIHVLVVGSKRCGKSQLALTLTRTEPDEIQALNRHRKNHQNTESSAASSNNNARGTASHSESSGRKEQGELFVRTTTFFAPPKGSEPGAAEEPISIAYTCVAPSRGEYVLTNRNTNRSVDVILLCYDGGNVGWSGRFIMEFFSKMKRDGFCEVLPTVMVMTKADTVQEVGLDEHGTDTLMHFCEREQLLWPPVLTSSTHVEEVDTLALNEYVHAVALEPELAEGNPPLTLVRKLRRATFAAIVVVALAGVAQTLITFVARRRAQK